MMVAMHSCFHGQNNPVSPSWDYVKGVGFGGRRAAKCWPALATSCGPPEDRQWLVELAVHWKSLYGDARVNAIACCTFGPQNGGRAYQTIACTTSTSEATSLA